MFTLYPGGGFDLNSPEADSKLRMLLDDRRFSKVITTQYATYDYLVSRGFCAPDQIVHLFGGLIPSCLSGRPQARAAKTDDKIDICFVAQRYTARGVEKGCDIFVDLVRKLRDHGGFRFHLVGGWTPENTGLPAGETVTFHGIKPASFFQAFYQRMDIILSPNISHSELHGGKGSFDGFPTTACVEAAVEGVAMFLTDSLGLNRTQKGDPIFLPGVEFERITRDVNAIAALLLHYHDDRDRLRTLAERGRAAVLREFSFERQIRPRLQLLEREIERSRH